VGDVAVCDELPDCAGRDCLAADGLRRVDADAEAQFAAECFETLDASLRVMAEAEVFAFMEFGDVQGLLQDAGSEGTGRHLRELFGEGQDEYDIDSG